MRLSTEWVVRLEEELQSYLDVDEERDTTLAGLALDAEESGCYRTYDYARSDWSDTMDEAGQRLAATVAEFLRLVKE